MKKIVLILAVVFFTPNIKAQSSLAKIEYSYAEEAFNNKNYAKAIKHLEEVKSLLGSTNARILYLEILSRNNSLPNYQSFNNSFSNTATNNTQSNAKSVMPQSTIDFINKNKKIMIKTYSESLAKYKANANRESLKNVINLFTYLIDKLEKGQNVTSADFLPSAYNNVNSSSKKSININKEKINSEIISWLNNVDVINTLCNTYLENFENDVPLDKLKKVYETKKQVKVYISNKELILQSWENLNNKEYETALNKFIKLQKAGIESNSVISKIQKTIKISQLDDKAISSIEKNMVLVKGNPDIFETTTADGKNKSISIPDLYVSKFELTKKEYMYIVNPESSSYISCESCPISLSRSKAEAFVALLNKKTGKKYRLPTREEWFWFATGGLKTSDKERGVNREKSKNISEFAWYKDNSNEERHKVGALNPNELGLYDIWGNVSEITTTNSVGGSYTTKKKRFTKGSSYTYSYNWNNEEDGWSTMGIRLVKTVND